MKTMMRYAWKVALLGVGAMVVACSEGMTMGTMSTASAGPTSSGSSTNGSSGTGASTGAGGGGTCTCSPPTPTIVTATCTANGTSGGLAVANFPGFTAEELGYRLTVLAPVQPSTDTPLLNGKQPQFLVTFGVETADGVAGFQCNINDIGETVTFVLR